MANPLLEDQSRREVLRNGGLLGMLALFGGTAAQITPANASLDRVSLTKELYRLTRDNHTLTKQIITEVAAIRKANVAKSRALANPTISLPIIDIDPRDNTPVFNIEREEFLAQIVSILQMVERKTIKFLADKPELAELNKTDPVKARELANEKARIYLKDYTSIECIEGCGERTLVGIFARGDAFPTSNLVKDIPMPKAPVGADIGAPQKRPNP